MIKLPTRQYVIADGKWEGRSAVRDLTRVVAETELQASTKPPYGAKK